MKWAPFADAACNRCGKNYQAGSPTVAPGGEFPVPSTSSDPLLAFRCSPAIKPYLPEDASVSQSFIVDAPVVYSQIAGVAAIDLPTRTSGDPLKVTVTVNGKTLATGSVVVNQTTMLDFSLKDLSPQSTPYDVECTATYGTSATYTAKSQLSYLPAPPAGRSVTKMDLQTGALLAKPANGQGGDYQTVFPFGFYTSFDYLSGNLANIDAIASQGYTVVSHAIRTVRLHSALRFHGDPPYPTIQCGRADSSHSTHGASRYLSYVRHAVVSIFSFSRRTLQPNSCVHTAPTKTPPPSPTR